jgi:valyl-tRNA synthetase
VLKDNADLIKLLAGLQRLEFDSGGEPSLAHARSAECSEKGKPSGSIGLAGNGFEAFVFIAEAVDMKTLREKFSKELEKDRKYVESLKGKLANENFLKNAPPELVAEEKLKLEDCVKKTGKLESYIRDMA